MNRSQGFCPYAGLRPYSDEEQEYFFGREEDQKAIASNALTTRLTIVYGASGVGKTSVLQAGVAPLLKKEWPDVIPVVFRRWQDRAFLVALKKTIIKESAVELPPGDALPLDGLILQVMEVTGKMVIVILDQFEEYFLYHPENETENCFDAELAGDQSQRHQR